MEKEQKIKYAESRIEDLKWKVKFHTTELHNTSTELEMWGDRLKELLGN